MKKIYAAAGMPPQLTPALQLLDRLKKESELTIK